MIRRSSKFLFALTLALSTFGSLPWCAELAQVHAQGSGISSWLPWSKKSADAAPVDPFRNRGGSAPEYRVADAQTAGGTATAPAAAPLPYPSNPYRPPGYTQKPTTQAVTAQIGDDSSAGRYRQTTPSSYQSSSSNYGAASAPTAATTQPWHPQQYQQGVAAWSQQAQPPATNPPAQAAYPPQYRNQAAAPPSQYGQSSQYGQTAPSGAAAETSAYPASNYSRNNYSAAGYAPQVANGYPATPATTPPQAASNASPGAAPATPTSPPQTTVSDDQLFAPARIIALVGSEPILAGDILGPVNQALTKRLAELQPEQRQQVTEEMLEEQRQMALRELLPGVIDTKMVYLDFIRTIPQDKLKEMQAHLDTQYAEFQLQKDLDQYGVHTAAELDIILRNEGSSLEKKKRLFLEQIIASQQLRTHVKPDTEVTHQQMLDYYYEHAADYEQRARARWEQLMVRFDKFATKAEAEQAIADMGNQVLRGAPLEAVAKKHSQGFRASDGGQYDWTTRNSLKNETIDAAIFSLPTNRLSQIIESPEGYHIVRVLEREEDSMKPFRDAQLEIKEKIRYQRANEAQRDYITGVRKRTQVWTIFDEEKSSQTASSAPTAERR